jgi:hypothetical protein
MLERFIIKGAQDALEALGIKTANPVVPPAAGGLMGRAKAFGAGQLEAGKDLFSNLRGGLGGKLNPDVLPAPGGDMDLTRSAHRARAVGNLKTLAPSLLAGGGLYYLHRRHQQAEDQRRQQGMAQDGYGQPMM